MNRLGMIFIGWAAIVVLASCGTTGYRAPAGPLPQVLSDDEKARLATYKAMEKGLLVDEVQTTPAEGSMFKIDPYTQAYEGLRIVRLLGLVDQLSVKDQYRFVKALFEKLPNPVKFGVPIRNIVVAKWYKNGEPLIVHVTEAFSGNKVPTLVVLFNTASGIRDGGEGFARSIGPKTEYPRFASVNGQTRIQAQEYYSMSILSDGRVSASGAIGKTLPSFDSVKDSDDRVNLTDDYLRDGIKDNDVLVVPVLKAVIADEKEDPINIVHAQLQLFMFYLFSGDLVAAKQLSDDLQKSTQLANPKVTKTELADAVRKDMPNILAIAKALSSGDESGL